MNISELYRAINPAGISPGKENAVPAGKSAPKGPTEFQDLLRSETERAELGKASALNLSQHAEARIKSRAIPWDSSIEKRVMNGIDQAQAKGSREALILADNLAVIANVKSRTVITAIDRNQLREKIFTNIDSAVLV